MTYTFYGEPNMLVNRRRKIGVGKVRQVPLFRFDENGEHVCTEDCYPQAVIERLKQRYRYEIENDSAESNTENKPDEVPEKIYKCKHCDFTCTDKVALMQHYRKEHPKNKGDDK